MYVNVERVSCLLVFCMLKVARRTKQTLKHTLSIHGIDRRPERQNYSKARMRPVVLYSNAHTHAVHSMYTFEKHSVSSHLLHPHTHAHRHTCLPNFIVVWALNAALLLGWNFFSCLHGTHASETYSWQVVTSSRLVMYTKNNLFMSKRVLSPLFA